MKKLSLYVLSFVVTISLILTFSSCTSRDEKNNNFDLINYENVDVNYNNTDDCSFWFEKGNLYYFKEDFIGKTLVCKNKYSEEKLFSISDLPNKNGIKHGDFSSVQVYGNFVYTLVYADDKAIFYEFDKISKQIEEITRTDNNVCSWAVKKDVLIFTVVEKYIDETVPSSFLYICDLNSKKDLKISSDVIDFGVVNNSIRFITYKQDDLKQQIFEYNLVDSVIKKISDINFYVNKDLEKSPVTCCDFDFTDDKIICYDSGAARELIVFDVNTLKIKSYRCEGCNMYCYDNFVFITSGGSDDGEFVKRIKLTNKDYSDTFIGNSSEILFIVSENQVITKSFDGDIYFVKINESNSEEVLYNELYKLK